MVGVASNYLDELRGRPWRTAIPSKILWVIGLGGYALSTAIGIYLSLLAGSWFLLFVVAWGFFVPCYSLELFGGRFHNAWTVALNSSLSALGCALLQVPALNSSILVVSMACGAIALYGRQHYELGKATGRDHREDPHLLGFWQWLKLEVLVIDIIALVTLGVRLSNSG